MGDTYRSRRTGGSNYESYQPPRHQQQYFANSYGSYRSPPRSPPPLSRAGGYNFSGPADNHRYPDPPRRDYYQPPPPPPSNFTFQAAGGPRAPRFPQEQPVHRPNRQSAHHRQHNGGRHQQGRRPGNRGPRLPKPAHARELLSGHTVRETTPEQLAGMNAESQPRYAEKISDDEGSDERACKRIKRDTTADPSRPKWSNPDPYSVLPPTDLGVGPKHDIVETIRRSKLERSAETSTANAVKENADFIGFDGSEEGSEEDNELEDGEMIDDTDYDNKATASTPLPVPSYKFILPTDEELMLDYSREFSGNGKKRKHEEISSGKAQISDVWRARYGFDAVPWYKETSFVAESALSLHHEVLDFYKYVEPRTYEQVIRKELIDRVERVVQGYKGARVARVTLDSFGSFASGLYLPVADIDLVASSYEFKIGGPKTFCQSKNKVWQLADHLKRSGIVRTGSLNPITKARVPIIKFADDKTGIRVDISFENTSGLIANGTVEKWKNEFPDMPILVAVIKQLLAMRDLNEVQYGGIGGFSIICLVVSMLQHISPEERDNLNPDTRYAHLLLHFLNLYGNKFDVKKTGIELVPPRRFPKSAYNGPAKMNDNRLTIIDPNNVANDLSAGSSNIGAIIECFRSARLRILRAMDVTAHGNMQPSSMLECILGGNYSLFDQQRRILETIYRQPPSFNELEDDSRNNGHRSSSASQYQAYTSGRSAPPSRDQGYQPSRRTHTSQSSVAKYSPQSSNLQIAPVYSPNHALPQRPPPPTNYPLPPSPPPPPPPSPPPPPPPPPSRGPPATNRIPLDPDGVYNAPGQPAQGNLGKNAKKAKRQNPAPKQPKQSDSQTSTSRETKRRPKIKKKAKVSGNPSNAAKTAATSAKPSAPTTKKKTKKKKTKQAVQQ